MQKREAHLLLSVRRFFSPPSAMAGIASLRPGGHGRWQWLLVLSSERVIVRFSRGGEPFSLPPAPRLVSAKAERGVSKHLFLLL